MDTTEKDEILRDLFLTSDVNSESTSVIIKEIIKVNNYDDAQENTVVGYEREPIKLYIQSFGGSAYDCWALVDVMLHSKTPIHTYCTGYAMSCGFLIFLAGAKRFASKHSTFMYHQISMGYDYTEYTKIKENMYENTFLQGMMERMVIKRTNIPKSLLEDVREKKVDWYIHLTEAVKYGIVDEIIQKGAQMFVFWFLVILALVIVWLLASPHFSKIGEKVLDIKDEVSYNINKDNEEEKEKE